MTFSEYIKDYLCQNGMFVDQAEAVLVLVKEDEKNKPMQGRWDSDMSGYPPIMETMTHFIANNAAVAWIDVNCPKVWFRYLFADKEVTP